MHISKKLQWRKLLCILGILISLCLSYKVTLAGTWTNYIFKRGLADNDGNKWFGTWGGGVSKYVAYCIRGYVKDSEGCGIEDVLLTLSGAASQEYITDSTGYYIFDDLDAGAYTVTPSDYGVYDDLYFLPSERSYTSLTSSQIDQNFIGSPYYIKGYVKDNLGNGIKDVLVSLIIPDVDLSYMTYTTQADGYYEFLGLPIGGYFQVAPIKVGCDFIPANREYAPFASNQADQNYIITFSAYEFVAEGTEAFRPVNNLLKPGPGNKTSLCYSTTQSGRVTIKIYTVDGMLVRTLYDEDTQAGVGMINWNGSNDNGSYVASGIYLAVIEAPGFREIKKICIVK